METPCLMESTPPSAGIGHRHSTLFRMARYLQQWVVAWNGYDGNIYISTADTLPSFQPPRVLLAKQSEEQKFWYPNIIHQQLGNPSQQIKYIVKLIQGSGKDRQGMVLKAKGLKA